MSNTTRCSAITYTDSNVVEVNVATVNPEGKVLSNEIIRVIHASNHLASSKGKALNEAGWMRTGDWGLCGAAGWRQCSVDVLRG